MRAPLVSYARSSKGRLFLTICYEQRRGRCPSTEDLEEGDWLARSVDTTSATKERYWKMANGEKV